MQSAQVSVNSFDTTPPNAPTLLTGAAPASGLVNLTWHAATDNPGGTGVIGYNVYRSNAGVNTKLNGSTVVTTTSYPDTTTLGTTTYNYTVTAVDVNFNESVQSSPPFPITTPDTIAPPTPTILTINAPASGTVNLTWSGVVDTGGSGLHGYNVYRGGVKLTTAGVITATNFSDVTTLGTTFYSYTVTAVDGANNESPPSVPASITTPDTIAPSAPSGLIATVISASQINLSWAASTDTGGSGMCCYDIHRNGVYAGGTTNATPSFTDTSVGGSTAYTYTVVARDNATPFSNISGQSSPITVTTPANVPSVPGTPTPHGKVTTLTFIESWTPSTGPIHHYVFQRTLNFGAPENFTVNAPTTSISQSGGNGDQFTFKVQGCNSSNQCSAFSGESGANICAGPGGTCP